MIPSEQQIKTLITKHGTQGLKIAKCSINNIKIPPAIKTVATYFLEENWPNTHHPALMALCCEAVKGDPTQTYSISAAIVLLTGAADIHDDIIDGTKIKSQKITAYGKFDTDLVLLTGDMLLFQGLILLQRTCEKFPKTIRKKIFDLIDQSFFKIGDSIVSERCFKGKIVNLAEYRQAIESKGAIAQACAAIGATIGQAQPSELKVLSDFGKTLGALMAIKNEFDDMRDLEELKSKLKNKNLPLPLLYATQDTSAMIKINYLLKGRLSEQKVQSIADLVMETSTVIKLRQELLATSQIEESALESLKTNKEIFQLLLKSSTTSF